MQLIRSISIKIVAPKVVQLRARKLLRVILLLGMMIGLLAYGLSQARATFSWTPSNDWTNDYYNTVPLTATTGLSSGNSVKGSVQANSNGVGTMYEQAVGIGCCPVGIDGDRFITFSDSNFIIPYFGQTTTEVDISPSLFVIGSINGNVQTTCVPVAGCAGGGNSLASFTMRFDVIQPGTCSVAGCTSPVTVFSRSIISDNSPKCTDNCSYHLNYNSAYNPQYTMSLSAGYYYASVFFDIYVGATDLGISSARAYACFQNTSDCSSTQPPALGGCPTGSQPVNNQCLYVQWSKTHYTVKYTDFTVAASPGSVSFNPTSSTTSTITVSSLNQFSSAVALTASSDDSNLRFNFSPSSITPSQGGSKTSTLTISDTSACDSGTHTVTISASSTDATLAMNTVSESTTISVSLLPCGDFQMSASPNTITMVQYTCWPSTITVSSLNGWSGTVTLSASNSPPSLAASFGVCGGSNPTTTVAVTSSAPGSATLYENSCTALPGSYATTIVGTSTSPARTHQVTISVTVVTYASSCGGGGGGSLAAGTLILMADGSTNTVQNIKAGDRLVGYDPNTGSYSVSIVKSTDTVQVNSLLVIHTESGSVLRTDASRTEVLWTKQQNGNTLWLPVTMLRVGDSLFTQHGWSRVTKIDATSVHQTMWDITATLPYFANGYLDPAWRS
ncbi:MAG: hypothetical protein AUF79_10855 [Crenarchaeota archaeon 13_1_20CM_2_51_8]|nr:MAG: hypothetical protein AUF79_10855 [Crenarchaeota archaeon 13_1_20CM_2_51_8]